MSNQKDTHYVPQIKNPIFTRVGKCTSTVNTHELHVERA